RDGFDELVEQADANISLSDTTLSTFFGGVVAESDTLLNVEEVSLTGGPGNNFIDATRSSLRTSLLGAEGNDTLLGGDGEDVINGGPGSDSINGGPGSDTVIASGDVNFTLSDTLLTGQGNDTLGNVEQATLIGGPSNNILSAFTFSGDVTMIGDDGHDLL